MLRIAVYLVAAGAASAQWLAPLPAGVEAMPEGNGWKLTHAGDGEFSLLSPQPLPARTGDTFEVSARIRAGIHTVGLPELACFDAAGNEIAARSTLEDYTTTTTTRWQEFQRTFVARPGTAAVRARLRGSGKGDLWVEDLRLRPVEVDTYKTGALYTAIYPRLRRGLVLESNLGILNRELVSRDDRDGDAKWAEIFVDLDGLSKLDREGDDWRTRFEYKPNEIYWSDGAVLKSDSVFEDRAPDRDRALHFRAQVHRGPYRVIVNDPGRAVAISMDGAVWRRFEGGREIELGDLPAADGVLEFWLDACYRDPVKPGPAYFDYVRVLPAIDPASEERLFAAARQSAPARPQGTAEEKRVRVRVEAPQFSGSKWWPVRAGVPIPRGELASAGQAAVRDAAGRTIPSQNRALATWPDGTVKWLYLDFFHDFSRSGRGEYDIVYGARVRPGRPATAVRLHEDTDGIAVDTGALQFRVPRARFGILERSGSPISFEIAETGGKTWRALDLPVARMEVEHAGPLHAVILVESPLPPSGKPASGFFYRARIHAYAGSRLVGIDAFVANTDARAHVKVASIAMKLPAKATESGSVVEPDGKSHTPGWIAAGGIGVGVDGFREQYPKALRWSPRGISIDLWASEGGEYEWVQGVGKTHRVAVFFDDVPGDGSLLAHGPVLALAAPEWYAASGAFGPIGTAAASPLPAVEETLRRHMEEAVSGKVGLGFENYGDHSSSGYVKGSYLWDNNEYDLPAGALVHFVRTGDREALKVGLASALHYVDVDCIHYSARNADWAGAAHTHSHSTAGHHTADNPNMHHAGYVQGLIWYSYLTGEPEGLTGARRIADWVLRNLKPESNVGQMERALGHPLMTLNDVYEATWDDRYLRGSARLIDWALKWEHPQRGGFLAPITEQPAYYSGSTFCSGMMYSALLKFNSWARLPELDALLERTARWVLTDMWRPPGGIMSKGGSPRRTADPQHIASHLRLMRDVFARTQDPLFLAVPREAAVLGFGPRAKSFGTRSTGLVFNYLPWFLPVLAEWKDSDAALELTTSRELAASPGGEAGACAVVRNRGADPVETLRIAFQARPDFRWVTPAAPVTVAPGAQVEVCTGIRAPEQINLTSDHNRISYAHWSLSYRRGASSHLAHAWTRIVLKPR